MRSHPVWMIFRFGSISGSFLSIAFAAIAAPSSRRAIERPPALDLNSTTQALKQNGVCPADHTGLLSAATACCYQRLVKNPNCCLDINVHTGIRWHEIERPDTWWYCNTSGHPGHQCFDEMSGHRGKDIMAIPEGASCSTPRILYIHGGSWMYGSPRTMGYPQLASRIAAATGAVVFVIDYPLVPVGNYSTIMHQAIQGLRWLTQHGPDVSCSPDLHVPLFVGGDSSGGGTALSLVLHLQRNPDLLYGRHISGAFFFSPWTNLMCNTPEYYTNAFAKIQSPQTFKDLTPLEQYVGDIIFQAITEDNAAGFSANALEYVGYAGSLQTDPVASPYFAQPDDYGGRHMPALHIVVGQSESIMGDSVRVAYAAAEGGLDVTLEIYNGMWHVFPMYSEGCGSESDLWAGKHALNTTAHFIRSLSSATRSETGTYGGEKFQAKLPRVHIFYDPMISQFSRVGELMPNTAAYATYQHFMKTVANEPWWVVLSSIGSSAIVIFVAGILVGGVLDFGGREAYKRAMRVADYRRKCVEVPVGYVNLDAINLSKSGAPAGSRLDRSFLADFIRGVPEDVHSAWRLQTVMAKQGLDDIASIDAARAENAAWRRMALPGYTPPNSVPQSPEERPPETLESGAAASAILKEVREASDIKEAWKVATTAAKDGSIEVARRENMAWRMQHMQDRAGSDARD